MIALALLLQAATPPEHGPWEGYADTPVTERAPMIVNPTTGEKMILEDGAWRPILGPGPHTLVVSDGTAMTRFDYKTGPACQRARDKVRAQLASPPDTAGRIYPLSKVKTFCVPR